jgi:ppGpp synthetase/RelA/SpoT-type nucleotidyltranferase
MQNSELVRHYIEKKYLYRDLSSKVAELVKLYLADYQINYEQVTYRTKTVRSLESKLYTRKIKNIEYTNLDQVVDLAGVRIIVFFKDDLERVADLIAKEFKVQPQSNRDHDLKAFTSPREFGYQSKHRIITLQESQAQSSIEYRRLTGLKCEIQIRTLLQHAWAEIEHDIGYKSSIDESEPERVEITRIFSQNAALLEVADENFLKIKKLYNKLLQRYRREIANKDLTLPLNPDSVRFYLEEGQDASSLDAYQRSRLESRASKAFQEAQNQGLRSLKDLDESDIEKN